MIPAEAGIHLIATPNAFVIPEKILKHVQNDKYIRWIPASAGMTIFKQLSFYPA